METSASQPNLDRLGVLIAVGCAVHCAIAPIVLVAAPLLGGIWVHPGAHLTLAGFALPIAAVSLRRGFRLHGRRAVLGTGLTGMGLVLAGVLIPILAPGAEPAAAGDVCRECCPTATFDEEAGGYQLSIPAASIVSFLGGLALVIAHIANLRGCRCCRGSRR